MNKNMDYEKKYRAVLEQARDYYNRVQTDYARKELENIFPELRESEDEEIRQQLLWLCGQWEHNPEGRTIPADIDNIRKIRNWLEKQKEQKHYWKPTETDTALFNKAVTTNKALTPTERAQLDIIRSKFGYCRAANCSGIVQKEQNPIQSNIEKEYIRTIKSLIADFLRGKRDIDARYYQKIYDWLDGRHIESKPIEWNEEDENIRKQLISICDEWLNGGYNARPCLDDVRWLKNLLENQKEPTTVEWNEEDKDYYDTIVRKLEVIGDDSGLSSNQIKFLREHCPLHRSEWSEEDETIIEGACSALEIHGHTKLASMLKSLRPQPHWKKSLATIDLENSLCDLQDNYHDGSYEYKVLGEAIEFIRCTEPSPSWKPSEEQMEALETAERWYSDNMGCNLALVSLVEQLKKL